ncbi:hypothetical protein ABW20_dc0108844 [Dactylellina cionopaga]|nr:hypothetical protein ABW20_dc0108844 [Dactylellina cionopaga]
MPAVVQRPRIYGTVRRGGGGTARNSFRGSVRAWDSQRNQSGGLLMQQSTTAAPQQPKQDKSNNGVHGDTYDSDSDSDGFALESPPDSPLADRSVPTQYPSPSPVNVKAVFNHKKEQDAPTITTMPPELRSRKPLLQKSDNELNRQQNLHKPKFGKRKSTIDQKTKSEDTLSQNVQPCCPTVSTESTKPERGQRYLGVSAAPTEKADSGRVSVGSNQGSDHELPRANESCPRKSLETFAVEIVSSSGSIDVASDVASDEEEEKLSSETENATTTPTKDKNAESASEHEEEYDDSAFLSPQQRAVLHNQARQKGRGRGPPLAVKRDSLVSGLRNLGLHTPSTPEHLETQELTNNISILSPSPTELPSPKIEILTPPDSVAPSPLPIPTDPVIALAPQSEVFNLLPFCSQNRVMTYAEYLATISPDFSRIKKIGESSFAEVYIHKTDDGRSVVLKFVPLVEESNVKEVIQELKITRALSPLPNFINYVGAQVVSGSIPSEFEAAWNLWEEKRNPEYIAGDGSFGKADYYAIIALEDGGCSLDSCKWNTWDVPLEIFRQTIGAFANAEREREFEHRDLHGGNLLVRDLGKEKEEEKKEDSGVGRELAIGGFEEVGITLIDYTLARAKIPEEVGGGIAFMELEEEMFEAEGLYQFDIYRRVREELVSQQTVSTGAVGSRRSGRLNKPDWSAYCSRSNVIWLHFLIKSLIRSDDGRRNGGKMRIWKPSKAKKHAFDLECWAQVMKVHEALDKEVDEGWAFGGAVDIERWCLEEGVFTVLEEERERRNGGKAGDDCDEEVADTAAVRRSRRLKRS